MKFIQLFLLDWSIVKIGSKKPIDQSKKNKEFLIMEWSSIDQIFIFVSHALVHIKHRKRRRDDITEESCWKNDEKKPIGQVFYLD